MLTRKVNPTFLVIRQGAEDATTDDWNELIDFISSNRSKLSNIRILVYTDGGIPTASQRKQLAQALGNSEVTVASVSDSMKVRFVSSTISLFVRRFRQFTTREIDRAFNHLRLEKSERKLAESALLDLESALYAGARKGAP